MSADPGPIARHFQRLAGARFGPLYDEMADRLVSDPQAHIDALVEAGVLKKDGWNFVWETEPPHCRGASYPIYAVVQPEPPHEHDWRVLLSYPQEPVGVHCLGCGESHDVVQP